MKNILFSFVMLLALPSLVLAGMTRYTFNDVVIDGNTYEIEAEVKDTKKSDFSRCDYFLDNYADWIGFYGEAVVAGTNAADVEAFCVAHFADRVLE